jgi:transposase
MLEKKIKAYENDKTSISCFSLIKKLPKMKKSDFECLKELDIAIMVKNKFRCVKCNFKFNADLNVYLNILNTVGHM